MPRVSLFDTYKSRDHLHEMPDLKPSYKAITNESIALVGCTIAYCGVQLKASIGILWVYLVYYLLRPALDLVGVGAF